MALIKFNRLYPYAHHGHKVERYKKDQVVEITNAEDSQDLAERAIADGAAEEISEKDVDDDTEIAVAEHDQIKTADVTAPRPVQRESKKSRK